MVLPTTPCVRALVRWATGKRLTSRQPKLSLATITYVLVPAVGPKCHAVGLEGSKRSISDQPFIRWDVSEDIFLIVSRIEFAVSVLVLVVFLGAFGTRE